MNPLIIILRIFIPLSILKYPLIGGGLSILLDNLDWYTKSLFGIDPIFEYQLIDKVLDTYYLAFLVFVSLQLKNHLMRNILVSLFIFRFIGFALFELTQVRLFLFFFPNIFENLFFFYFIIKAVARYEPNIKYITAALFVFIVSFPKVLQEYSMHVIQKSLEIDIFSITYIFEGTIHQMLYILLISIAFGIYYRVKKHNGIV